MSKFQKGFDSSSSSSDYPPRNGSRGGGSFGGGNSRGGYRGGYSGHGSSTSSSSSGGSGYRRSDITVKHIDINDIIRNDNKIMTGNNNIENLRQPVSEDISKIMEKPMIRWTLKKTEPTDAYYDKLANNFNRMALSDEFSDELKKKVLAPDAIDQHTYIIDAFLKQKHHTFGIAYDGVALSIEDKIFDKGGYIKLSNISKTAAATLFTHFVLHKFNLLRGNYPRLQPLGIWFQYDTSSKTFEARLFIAYFPDAEHIITPEIRNANKKLVSSAQALSYPHNKSMLKAANDMLSYTPMLISLAWAWRVISSMCEMDPVLCDLGNPSGIMHENPSASPEDIIKSQQHSRVSAHVQGNPASYGLKSEKFTWDILQKKLTPIEPYRPFATSLPPTANGWEIDIPITPKNNKEQWQRGLPVSQVIEKDKIAATENISPIIFKTRVMKSDKQHLIIAFNKAFNMVTASPDAEEDEIKKKEVDDKKARIVGTLIDSIIGIESTINLDGNNDIWDSRTEFGQFCNNGTKSQINSCLFGTKDDSLGGIVPRQLISKKIAAEFFSLIESMHLPEDHAKYAMIEEFGKNCRARIAEFLLMTNIKSQKSIFEQKCFPTAAYKESFTIMVDKIFPLHYKISARNMLPAYINALVEIEKLCSSLALSNDGAEILASIQSFTKDKFGPIMQKIRNEYANIDSISESLVEISNKTDKRISNMIQVVNKYKNIRSHDDLEHIAKEIDMFHNEVRAHEVFINSQYEDTFYKSMGNSIALLLSGLSSREDLNVKELKEANIYTACTRTLTCLREVLTDASTDPLTFKYLADFDGLYNAYNYLDQFSRCLLSDNDGNMMYESYILAGGNNEIFDDLIATFKTRMAVAIGILQEKYETSKTLKNFVTAHNKLNYLIKGRCPEEIAKAAARLIKKNMADTAMIESQNAQTKKIAEDAEKKKNMQSNGSSSHIPAPTRALSSLSFRNESKNTDKNDEEFTTVNNKKNKNR